ncbi:MAG: TAXI family TRAP transporter solute-binding subunit [Acidobacteriota bacterium]
MTPMRPAAAFLALAVLTTAACSAPGGSGRREGKRRLSIATGGTGGVYYPYGGAIAKVISEQLPGTEATAEVTAASVDNLKFLRDGKADIAFTLADTLADAVGGRGPFQGQPVAAQALAVLYDNYTHVVTLAGNGINSLADLKDKAVSTGSPGSGSEVIAFRLLEAAGINHDTGVRRQGLGVSQSVDALKDGKIQAFFWSGGLPTAAILDLGHTPGITMRLLPNASYAAALQRTYGERLYSMLTVPAAAYPGPASDDVPVVGVANVLVVNAAMPEALAFDITRLLFEKRGDLVAIHPEAEKLGLKSATQGSPAAYHPGAIRYYKSQHAWPE